MEAAFMAAYLINKSLSTPIGKKPTLEIWFGSPAKHLCIKSLDVQLMFMSTIESLNYNQLNVIFFSHIQAKSQGI